MINRKPNTNSSGVNLDAATVSALRKRARAFLDFSRNTVPNVLSLRYPEKIEAEETLEIVRDIANDIDKLSVRDVTPELVAEIYQKCTGLRKFWDMRYARLSREESHLLNELWIKLTEAVSKTIRVPVCG